VKCVAENACESPGGPSNYQGVVIGYKLGLVGEDHVEYLGDGGGGDPVKGSSDVERNDLACFTAGSTNVIYGAHETVGGVGHLLAGRNPNCVWEKAGSIWRRL